MAKNRSKSTALPEPDVVVTEGPAYVESPVEVESPVFDHEQPPAATLAGDTLDAWFYRNADWIQNEAADSYHIVRKFCEDFDVQPILKCDMMILSPRRDPREICAKLLAKKK